MLNNSCLVNLNVTSRYYAFATVYSMVLLVGLPLNGLSLWILLKRHGLRTSNTVFMANLALSDLLLALSLPLHIYYYATARWPLGAAVCTVTTMLYRLNIFFSSVFITYISVDRMLAVAFPLRSRSLRSAKFAASACVATWLLISAISIPMGIRYNEKLHICRGENCFDLHVDMGSKPSRTGTYVFPFLVVFILLPVNVSCTALVIRALHRCRTHLLKNRKTDVMLVFVANLLMFVVFFIPACALICSTSLNIKIDIDVVRWTLCFLTLNCCLDPLIYYFALDTFWKREVESDT
ncbi:lysophosphatidic acid receptor 4-like [Megalops cyprinoides]|uniref:lysophosphatidic acid receptor 4-like n=1 Tax=Megalops cyprinoides TaxID=118141 RepID=UPI0018642E7D|nr:lysophosphatidic acid receptor 4-like [Megalops cyprinoides]